MTGGDRGPAVRRASAIIDGVPQEHRLPSPDECHVWVHRRAGGAPAAGARTAYTGAMRLLLLELVTRYLPAADPTVDRTCARCEGPHGKPVVLVGGLPSSLRVSVAHAGEVTVFAFTDEADVGIDVELVRPAFDWTVMLDHVFSDAERRLTDEVADPASRRVRYYERWVAKEAVLKAMGVGLNGPLQEVDTTGGRDATWNGWSMAALPLELPLVGAVACARPVGVRLFSLPGAGLRR